MTNIIMIGPPCSGKGTHSKIISNHFGLAHISTGDLFRSEIVKETPIGMMAKTLIDFGNFIPDSITMKILYQHIQNNSSNAGYLLDGFPRTLPQAELFDKYLTKHHLNIDLVLYLHAPEEELLTRMEKRSSSEKRADDNAQIFINRIKNYYKNTHILTDYYLAQGKLASISTNRCIEEVSEQVRQVVNKIIQEKSSNFAQ